MSTTSLLSHNETQYLLSTLKHNIRPDGRQKLSYRAFNIELNAIQQTNGSARVTLADGTDVIVGVKLEFATWKSANVAQQQTTNADAETPGVENTPEQDVLNLHVDWTMGASDATMGASSASSQTQTEAWRDALERMMRFGLDLDQLKINDQSTWILYVDALVLDSSGGNVLDCLAIAAKAALFDTKIPKVNVVSLEQGQWDVDVEEDPMAYWSLDVKRMPICVTLLAIRYPDNSSEFLVDPLQVEELYMESRLIVATNSEGKICSVQKTRCGAASRGLPMPLLHNMIQTAQKIGVELSKRIDKLLESKTIEQHENQAIEGDAMTD